MTLYPRNAEALGTWLKKIPRSLGSTPFPLAEKGALKSNNSKSGLPDGAAAASSGFDNAGSNLFLAANPIKFEAGPDGTSADFVRLKKSSFLFGVGDLAAAPKSRFANLFSAVSEDGK